MRFSLLSVGCLSLVSACVTPAPEPRAAGAPAPVSEPVQKAPAAAPAGAPAASQPAAPVAPREPAAVAKAPAAPGAAAPAVPSPAATEAPAAKASSGGAPPATEPAPADRPADLRPQAEGRPATARAARRSPGRELSTREREARARAAFALLSPKEQREVCDWLENEARDLATFQNSLLRFVLKAVDVDPGTWPELAQPPHFDPEKHAPAQPIARHPLSPDDPQVLAAQEMILGTIPPRDLASAWIYDYVSREPRRLPGVSDPQRIFDNALLGMPPGWDYAEALVERMLDDGSQQKTLAAFEHSYTDRTGGVYPGITLYEAWASRSAIEMPDVDNVAIIHEVLDDWQTWKAVITDDQQGPLYAKVGELFMAAYRYRGLRNALARTFLCGSTELRDNYQLNLNRFHSLWESVSSTPETLAAKLPDAEGWRVFLEEWVQTVDGDQTLRLKGIERRFVLDQDGLEVQKLVQRLLEQYGAFKRLDEQGTRPAAEPPR